MTDKERILMIVLDQIRSAMILVPEGARRAWSSEAYRDRSGDGYYAHFAPWKKPEAGDLVIATTSGPNDWKIGWVHEVKDANYCVIREIGSERLCDYGNESFEPIIGIHPSRLREGKQYEFEQKVLQAFRLGDEYLYRYRGLRFEGDNALVKVGEVFGGLGSASEPFEVTIPWTKPISVKRILATMRLQGYGTRSFRPQETTASI